MVSESSGPLRLYTAPVPSHASGKAKQAGGFPAQIESLCVAFRRATGWSLRFEAGPPPLARQGSDANHDRILEWSAPADAGVGIAPGHLRIDLLKSAGAEHDACLASPAEFEAACDLAGSIVGLINQRSALDRAIRERDAELAVLAMGPTAHSGSDGLAHRLESVVRGGAEALGCQAAVMYLLDDATTQLSIRASWGLSADRSRNPSRDLDRATADLEALLGHAVVLEDDTLFDLWGVPEPQFSAAVCVPLLGSTTVLGTFWMFSNEPRDFKTTETNLVEILAGRLACELELASQGSHH